MTIRPDILRAALQPGPGLTPAGTRDPASTGTAHGRPDLILLEQVLAWMRDRPGTAPAAQSRPPQPGPGQPPGFLAAVTRLGRLLAACPDAWITHTEDPWAWTVTIAPARQGGEASLVSGATLTGLADALQAEVTRRAGAGAALQALRATWGDRYQIWFDGQWRYRRHDGRGGEISAPDAGALHKLIADDYACLPGRARETRSGPGPAPRACYLPRLITPPAGRSTRFTDKEEDETHFPRICRVAGGDGRGSGDAGPPPAGAPVSGQAARGRPPGRSPGRPTAGDHGCPLCGCPPRMHPAWPGRAGLLVAWLADKYARPLRSADMARAIGRSVRAMEATCRRELGMTPHQLLAGIRLQRAHLLLTGPVPRSYTEVAASVGFGRASRFTAAYRRRYPGAPAAGASPARRAVTPAGAAPASRPAAGTRPAHLVPRRNQ